MDSKTQKLLTFLSQTKVDSYLAFEIEGKTLESIASERSLAVSTIAGHLADAIVVGLPCNLTRLGVFINKVNELEQKLREAPINSSTLFDLKKLSEY